MVLDIVAAPTPITAEQLERWPDDEERIELVRGRIERVSPAGGPHGRTAARLLRLLGNHVAERGLGEVYAAETGFLLARDPDTVRAPDAAFVRGDRVADLEKPTGFLAGPPDLAVEVVSPSDTNEAVDAKILDYLDAGTRQVWVISPRHRTLRVVESRRSSRILGPDDVLDGGDLLPGLSLRVGELFPE